MKNKLFTLLALLFFASSSWATENGIICTTHHGTLSTPAEIFKHIRNVHDKNPAEHAKEMDHHGSVGNLIDDHCSTPNEA